MTMSLLGLPKALLLLLALYARHAYPLGIDFTAPPGGSTFPAGPLTISWTDAGGQPDMSDLTTYTLELIVGGITSSSSSSILNISSGPVAQGTTSAEIPANISQSIQNGFYLKMTSNTADENQVINYSERFTLINMNGTTENEYLEGANTEAGDVTNVPEAQYNVIAQPTTSSATSTPTATTAPTQTSSTDDTDDNDGLQAPSKAGLIAGSILAVVGLISIIAWIIFFVKRVKRRRNSSKADPFSDTETLKKDPAANRGHSVFLGNKTELPAYRSSTSISTAASTPMELQSHHSKRFEMQGSDYAAEVPGSPMVYELEGHSNVWEAGSGRRSQAWDPTA